MIPLVYLGPSLPVREAQHLLHADYRPPVKRGDLPACYDGMVVIIDGDFLQSLSVSPKEILNLIDRGTRVIGAASMGALRAAELHRYGMEGYGWIFNAYRTGLIEGDDEVAVSYSQPDLRALTVPLVNIRRWLEQLRAANFVDAQVAQRLYRRAKRIFFADRTERELIRDWEEVVGKTEICRLLNALGDGITDVKAADARLTLETVRKYHVKEGYRGSSRPSGPKREATEPGAR
jgi:TfuA protein